MLSYFLSQASLRKKRKNDTSKEEQVIDEDSHVVPDEQMEDLFDEDFTFR